MKSDHFFVSFRLFISIVMLAMFVSCSGKVSHEFSSNAVVFPDSLLPFNMTAKSFKHINNQPTVVTLVDSECHIGIIEMRAWSGFIDQGLFDKEWNYYFIAEGSPNFYFNEYVSRNKMLQKLPIFLDKDRIFIQQNKLEAFRRYRTLVLNEKGIMIFAGSPYYEPSYADKIIHIISNKHD
jgi:hypothetical protein